MVRWRVRQTVLAEVGKKLEMVEKGGISRHSVINRSLYQVFYHYSFSFLLLYFSIYSVGNSVTLCDIVRDKVTSQSHVTHSLVGSAG